jgi:phosphoenolpyruvate carboxykinase (ATP)
VNRLDPEAEPEIYATTGRFGTVLENVVMDPATRLLDLDDNRYTENTRASYPLDFIPNVVESGRGGQPQNIVMLTETADTLARLGGLELGGRIARLPGGRFVRLSGK